MKQTGRPERILLRCHLLALGFASLLFGALQKARPYPSEDQWENKQLLVNRLRSLAVVRPPGNGYLSPLNCYLGSPSFCAAWHFPPLPPWADLGQTAVGHPTKAGMASDRSQAENEAILGVGGSSDLQGW